MFAIRHAHSRVTADWLRPPQRRIRLRNAVLVLSADEKLDLSRVNGHKLHFRAAVTTDSFKPPARHDALGLNARGFLARIA
jgi:hypothetical protein